MTEFESQARLVVEGFRMVVGRYFATGLIILFLLGSAGCLVAPVVPPLGFVYSGTSAPLDHDFHETKLGEHRGTSSSTTILGLVAWGDASTHAAAVAGGISTVTHADYEYRNVLGIYQQYTTIVYGD